MTYDAEELNRLAKQGYVFDHEYRGNICGGMGGRTECRKITTNGKCRKGPFEHHYIKPRHRRSSDWEDDPDSPDDHKPTHRRVLSDEVVGEDGFVQVSHRGRKVRCPACQRSLVLLEEEVLAVLPEADLVPLPCGCKAGVGYLRYIWGVEESVSDLRSVEG